MPAENKLPLSASPKDETISAFAGSVPSAAAVAPCSLALLWLQGELSSQFNCLGSCRYKHTLVLL